MNSMPEAFLLKILLAAALGATIGLERELAQKEAGLRTNILIAVGSTLLTVISQQINGGADPARISAQIVTGIGFIGAGAIIQARRAVQGITTAATIWMVAGIGMAVGYDLYLPAFLVTLLAVTVLTLLRLPSRLCSVSPKNSVYQVRTEAGAVVLLDIKQIMAELGIKPLHLAINKKDRLFDLEIVFNTSENKNRLFLERLLQLKEILEITNDHL